ncbi:MAG: glycosyltransferase [Geminicoccaceae bacterium]
MVSHRPLRVALISGSVIRHDAISASVLADARAFSADPRFMVQLFSYCCDAGDVPHRQVGSLTELLLDPCYLASDALIFHFGIYYELFNALLLGNGHGRRIVRYHNVTPPELLPPASARIIGKSLDQQHAMAEADAIWPVSPFNHRCLLELGLPPERIEVLPLAVDWRPAAAAAGPQRQPLILYVGRFVTSKGLLDLVEALALLQQRQVPPFRAVLAGSRSFSDAGCIDALKARLRAHGLDARVEIRESVADAELRELYGSALLAAFPSYHEGFGVPVIEALAGGAIPVVADAAALPETLDGLGRVVPVRSPPALAAAMAELLTAHAAGQGRLDPVPVDRGRLAFADYRRQVAAHLAAFAPDHVAAELRRRVLDLVASTHAHARAGSCRMQHRGGHAAVIARPAQAEE